MLNQIFLSCLILFPILISNTASGQSNKTESRPAIKGKTSFLVNQDEASRESKNFPAQAVGTGAKVPEPAEAPAATVSASTVPALRKVERKEITSNPSNTGGETYLFQYRFTQGLSIRSEVIHLAKMDNKIDASAQNSNSRTVSQKTWEVIKVENGEMTFEYRIVDIDMSQQIGTEEEIRYSSKSNEPAARQFQTAADSVGKVISTVTIDQQGMIVARSDETNPPNLGMGDITLPVPAAPVGIGSTWEIPRELRIQRDDGSLKMVRFRELFRLDKVSAGVASITIRSEMLTPITDPKEEAQVLQQLSNGTIKFDLDAGRMLSKELAWDKAVVGFAGSGSVMDYSARLDENVVKAETVVASKATVAEPASKR